MTTDIIKLQNIYEDYRGQSFDPYPKGYTATDAGPGYTYRKGQLPTGTPGGAGGENTYTPGMNPGIAEVAEEIPVKKQNKISEWIDLEIKKAKMYGMDYAVMVLSELKKEFKF